MMNTKWILLIALVAITIFVIGIYTQVVAIGNCGFWKTMMLGKNAFWAYQMGMCD